MSRLLGVELRLIGLALRKPVGTSAGPHDRRPVVVVRVVTDRGDGWGECAALRGGTSVDPGVEAVWEFLVGLGAPRLVSAARWRDGELPAPAAVAPLFGESALDRLGGAALEMAVLDAELRRTGGSVAARLGATRSAVAVGALAGIPPDGDVRRLLDEVDTLAGRGYRRVRIKIAPGFDVEPVRRVRAAHPDLALQADANGAYELRRPGPRAAENLRRLDGYALTCIEQPLAPADLASHAELAALLETPVALDESLTSPRRVAEAIKYGALGVACLKPGRLGGLFAARRALALCRQAGVPAFVGGFFEAGLGRSANAGLAALDGFALPGDLSAPRDYLTDDPFGYPEVRGGTVAVPGGPGIADVPPAALLERLTRERRWLDGPA